MRLPRLVHRVWAAVTGHFWQPCPVCGEPFGGHEVADDWTTAPVPCPDGCGLAVWRLVCPACHHTRAGVA